MVPNPSIPAGKKILYVSWSTPLPTTAGTRQRSNILMRALRELAPVDSVFDVGDFLSNADVERIRSEFGEVTLCPHSTPSGASKVWSALGRVVGQRIADRLALQIGGIGTLFRAQPEMSRVVREHLASGRYALVVTRYFRSFMQSDAAGQGVPVLLDMDDWDPQLYRAEASKPQSSWLRRIAMKRRARQLDRLVGNRLHDAGHVFLAAADDLPEARRVGHRSVSVLPNIPFQSPQQPIAPRPPRDDSQVLLMVGSMGHAVNVSGANHFIRTVWPQIRERAPHAVFRIVGSGMTDVIRAHFVAPGVEPVGEVADLGEQYARCALSIVPIYEGGGTKIKLLESLAFGRLVVTTPQGIRGYEELLRHGESVVVANDAREMADTCVALLNDPAHVAVMAESGRRVVETHFSYARVRELVHGAVRSLVTRPPGGAAIATHGVEQL
jgi:polysaccharide biosynthesis protein PslH